MVLGPFGYFLSYLPSGRPLMRSTWLMALMAAGRVVLRLVCSNRYDFVVRRQTSLAIWCFAMIAAILPYISLTLVSWVAATKSLWVMRAVADWFYRYLDPARNDPGQNPSISPVTALWIIAIPLMDMVAICTVACVKA